MKKPNENEHLWGGVFIFEGREVEEWPGVVWYVVCGMWCGVVDMDWWVWWGA